MEYVKMEKFFVERCANKMMETGECATERVSVKQNLVLESVRVIGISVVIAQGAIPLMTNHSKYAMETAFPI